MCVGIIPNCPINLDDIKNVNTIFGLGAPSLKGKTTRLKQKPMVSNYAKITMEILKLHKTVSVTTDIMFVNGM